MSNPVSKQNPVSCVYVPKRKRLNNWFKELIINYTKKSVCHFARHGLSHFCSSVHMHKQIQLLIIITMHVWGHLKIENLRNICSKIISIKKNLPRKAIKFLVQLVVNSWVKKVLLSAQREHSKYSDGHYWFCCLYKQ